MPWMQVRVIVDDAVQIENVVNTDTISRFGSASDGGSYIKFIDGSSIRVADPMSEIVEVVLKADSKKVK